jgi:hypothetical protein
VGIMLYIATQSTLFIFVVKVTTIISGTDDWLSYIQYTYFGSGLSQKIQ